MHYDRLMDSIQLDILRNRGLKKYSRKEMALRILWGIFSLTFRFSPRPFFFYRNFVLRSFGASIGKHVHIYNSAIIYMPWNLEIGDWSSIGEHAYIYNLGKVHIGERATISHRAHICAGTHDYNDPAFPLIKTGINIGDQSWICADCFIGPGVTVGEGAIVGARGVVVKNVRPWDIVAGNPSRKIGERVMKK